MKIELIILLFIFCLTASLQCQKDCIDHDYKLDISRSWLPFKGKTQLPFLGESGNLINFNIKVSDTTLTLENGCDVATHIYESIHAAIFINPIDSSDIITFSLNPPHSLIVDTYSDSFPSFYIKDVFKDADEGKIAKRISNYIVGNRTYAEAILLFQNPKTSCPIDSIILANNVGIVGFNNFAKKYTLQ